MILRSLVIFACFAGFIHACDCTPESVQEAKNHSTIVFRGTIAALRDSKEPVVLAIAENRKVVVFRVKRAWKGDVGRTLEMPAQVETTACMGFMPSLLKIGNDLLVYAGRLISTTVLAGDFARTIIPDHPIYIANACHTALAKDTTGFEDLGPGQEPKKPTLQESK